MDVGKKIKEFGSTATGRFLTLALAGATLAEGQSPFHGFQLQQATDARTTLVSPTENTSVNSQTIINRAMLTITVAGSGMCYTNGQAAAIAPAGKTADRVSPSELQPVAEAMAAYQEALKNKAPPLLEQAGRDIVVANAEALIGNTQKCTQPPANDAKPVDAVVERMPGAVFISLANPLIGVKYTQAPAEKLELAYDDGRSTLTFANGQGGDKAAQALAKDIQAQMRDLKGESVPQDLVDKIHRLTGAGQPATPAASAVAAPVAMQAGQVRTPGQNGDSDKLVVTVKEGAKWFQATREGPETTLDITTANGVTRYVYGGSSVLMKSSKDAAGLADNSPFVRQPPALTPGFVKLEAALRQDTLGTGAKVDPAVEQIIVSIDNHIGAGFGSKPVTGHGLKPQ